VLHGLGDAFLTIGAGGALEHGSSGGPQNALTDRLLVDRGRDVAREPSTDDGLLARVPDWVILLGAAAIIGLAASYGFR
jgi:hypothetical protein